jgi:hypothetical protein
MSVCTIVFPLRIYHNIHLDTDKRHKIEQSRYPVLRFELEIGRKMLNFHLMSIRSES